MNRNLKYLIIPDKNHTFLHKTASDISELLILRYLQSWAKRLDTNLKISHKIISITCNVSYSSDSA